MHELFAPHLPHPNPPAPSPPTQHIFHPLINAFLFQFFATSWDIQGTLFMKIRVQRQYFNPPNPKFSFSTTPCIHPCQLISKWSPPQNVLPQVHVYTYNGKDGSGVRWHVCIYFFSSFILAMLTHQLLYFFIITWGGGRKLPARILYLMYLWFSHLQYLKAFFFLKFSRKCGCDTISI